MVDYETYKQECLRISEDTEKFKEFKRNNNITYMLEENGPAEFFTIRFCDILTDKYSQLFEVLPWEELLKNDTIGNPILCDTIKLNPYVTKSSHTTLRYILYALNICKSLKERECKEPLTIVEVGCGYGGQAVILEKILLHFGFSVKEYVVIDLPEVMQLTGRYLSEMNNTIVSPIFDRKIDSINPNLFLSFYSLGEIPEEFQNFYIENLVDGCKYGYIVWNHKKLNPNLCAKHTFDIEEISPRFFRYISVLKWPKIVNDNINFALQSHSSPYFKEYQSLMITNSKHLAKLHDIIRESGEYPEESIMNIHFNNSYFLNTRQVDLYILSKLSSVILNIGFNAGHSTLIMLLSNSNTKILCVDICEHKYTEKCFEYLDSVFPNRIYLLKGESKSMINSQNITQKVDMVNINGSQDSLTMNIDFWLSKSVSTSKAYVIWNNLDHYCGLSFWEGYVQSKVIIPFTLLSTEHLLGQINV